MSFPETGFSVTGKMQTLDDDNSTTEIHKLV